jgi:hypothetical protein
MTEQARETPEALTPEEERQLRVAVKTGLVLNHHLSVTVVARLLATIDVLRAAIPDPARQEAADTSGPVSVRDLYFYEAGIAEGRQEAADTSGLREALEAACDAWTEEHGPAGYAANPPAWFRQARAARRAATPDLAEPDGGWDAWIGDEDEVAQARGRAATPDPAEPCNGCERSHTDRCDWHLGYDAGRLAEPDLEDLQYGSARYRMRRAIAAERRLAKP